MRAYLIAGPVIVYGLFVALAAYIIWIAHDMPSGGGVMPIFAASGVIALSLVRIVRDLRSVLARRLANIEMPFDLRVFRVIGMFALSAGYLFAIFILGYFTSTLLFLSLGALLLGVRDWRALVIAVLALIPLMYGFFVLFLGANLPRGLLI